jgi:hypothetical protein
MNAPRWFFVLLVPLAWGGCSLVHFQFPGDEYAMYFISSMAGAWLCIFVRIGDIHQWWIPWSVAATGASVMAGVGWALMRLAASHWLWLALWAGSTLGLLALMISEYPSLERALSKNGSWWAYVCSAALMGSYVASALSLVLAPLLRWRQRSRASLQ